MSPGRGKRAWALRLAVLAVVTAAAAGIAIVITSAKGTTTNTSSHHSDPTAPVGQFVADWHAHDYAGMYALLTPRSRVRVSLARFTALYTRAATVATMRGLRPVSPPRREGSGATLTMSVDTRLFGRVSEIGRASRRERV